ncbi:MAG: recombination mediator RecR [Bdellovibrionales bacterium]
MLQIAALEKLVHELSKLPGIGPKTAQRLAYYILKNRDQYPDRLKEGLTRVQSEIHDCPQCFNFTDSDICRYCSDTNRRNELLCVVEEPSDIDRIESSRAFQGRYHVLHGALSPLEGIGPEKLKLQELVQRIEDSEIKEVILALDSDLEGDTTVLYISRLLQGKGVRMSRIAQGIPIGSDIDYVDDRTMGRALQNRVEI